jgi:hypothetical protein
MGFSGLSTYQEKQLGAGNGMYGTMICVYNVCKRMATMSYANMKLSYINSARSVLLV